jgi:hypothetical protein
MATVEAAQQKVQRILASNFDNVMLSKDGGFAIERGTTRVNIEVKDWGKDPKGEPSAIVRLWAPVVRKLKATPEFYRWAATEGQNFIFGSVTVVDDEEDGTSLVAFDHTLLADYLDPDELVQAVVAIVLTADDIDDKVHERFGGLRYTDQDPEATA